MSPTPGTSDISSVESTSLKSLEQFVNDLNDATRAILDHSTRRYPQVQALITCWPDELSDCQYILESARRLNEVFKNPYHFTVDENPYELAKRKAHLCFSKKITKYLTEDEPGFTTPERPEDPAELFSLYYGGPPIRDVFYA